MSFKALVRGYSARILFSLVMVVLCSALSAKGYIAVLAVSMLLLVYLVWVPTSYLLLIALGLLIIAALSFKPLFENITEAFLRFVYYVLILTVSREILTVVASPFQLTTRLIYLITHLESNTYLVLVRITQWAIQTFQYLRLVLTTRFHRVVSLVTRTKNYIDLLTAQPHTMRNIRLIFFGVLTVLVVWPWFIQGGYLFLLDNVWPPVLTLPSLRLQRGYITSVPHEWLFWLASQVIPTSVVQKFTLTIIIFLSGLSASQLVAWISSKIMTERPLITPSLVAGAFYALNPFVLPRIFMGQLYFLLGYALMPWVVLSLLCFMQKPTTRTASLAALAMVGVAVSSAHHLVLLPLVVIPLLIGIVRSRYSWRWVSVVVLPVIIFFIAFAIVYTQGSRLPFDPRGPYARLLQAPYTDLLGIDIFALTALWKTDLLFAFPHDLVSRFTVYIVLIAALISCGILYLEKNRLKGFPWLSWQLFVVGAIGFVLASGVSHPLTEPFSRWLYAHVPGWLGMRESGKFMANLALAQAIFLGIGVAAVSKWTHRISGFFLLLIMLIFVSPAYHGLSGQIVPQQYPDSWIKARQIISHDTGRPRAVVFPWYTYVVLDFLDRHVVINPAAHFFDSAEVLVGDNDEIGGLGHSVRIVPTSTNPFSKKFLFVWERKDGLRNLGALLAEDKIRYIILLADDIDAGQYVFLYNQKDLELVLESPEIVVWRNIAW